MFIIIIIVFFFFFGGVFLLGFLRCFLFFFEDSCFFWFSWASCRRCFLVLLDKCFVVQIKSLFMLVYFSSRVSQFFSGDVLSCLKAFVVLV